jgi:hypothetical protein
MVRKILLSLLAIGTHYWASAQQSHAPAVPLKKTIIRNLYIKTQNGIESHQDTETSDTANLIETMAKAIIEGKLVAYGSFDHSFTTKLPSYQIHQLIGRTFDTSVVTDPTTGEDHLCIVERDFSCREINKLRILEEWSFVPTTGKTEIKTIGVAPVRDVLGDDSVVRGQQVLFWVRYKDVYPLLEKYARTHPGNSLSSYIWNDYFSNNESRN